MPGLLDILGRAASAALDFFKHYASDTTPVTTILDLYRSTGGAIRTDAAYTLMRVLRNKGSVNDYIKLGGLNAVLPDQAHTLSILQFSGGANYQYTVLTNAQNELTPEAIYVNSETALSANQIFAKAASSFNYEEGSGMTEQDLSDVTFEIDDARYTLGTPGTNAADDLEGLGLS